MDLLGCVSFSSPSLFQGGGGSHGPCGKVYTEEKAEQQERRRLGPWTTP